MGLVDLDLAARQVRTTPGFDAFFLAEYAATVRVVAARAGDVELAADCAADAFERACRRWDEVALVDEPRAWVRRVALNRFYDSRRFLARRDRLLQRIGVPPDRLVVNHAERDDEVLAAVALLSEQQRAAVALHYLDDLAVEDVAAVLGVSEGTVKYHLHHARIRLRTLCARLVATA